MLFADGHGNSITGDAETGGSEGVTASESAMRTEPPTSAGQPPVGVTAVDALSGQDGRAAAAAAAGRKPHVTLTASRRLQLLDDLRVPYATTPSGHGPWHSLSAGGAARSVYWYAGDGADPMGGHLIGDNPFWGRVASQEAVAEFSRGLDGRWRPDFPVLERGGAVRSWVWTSDEGGTILPFDPDEVIANYRTERYVRICAPATASLEAAMRHLFYKFKPLIPRRLQIAARRSYSRVQAHGAFPRWPIETALHDLSDMLLERVADAAGEPVPYIAPWPGEHTWALVLTHDVETDVGRDAIERVRAVESPLGLRSSWNLVPERYQVADELIDHLYDVGCEVGVHGLRHDGRDLESLRTLTRRLPEVRRWSARWKSVGFRSPATHRVWEWMPMLGFDYDSSYPDTDPYEPMGGGCCSWLPFFNGALVELPITLPQDHTIFQILGIGDDVWHEKAALLRRRGGMALIDTHPDYMLEAGPLRAYERFLAAFGRDPSAWTPLPAEVSEWWRRRAATSLQFVDGSWQPCGPAAADARVAFAGGSRAIAA